MMAFSVLLKNMLRLGLSLPSAACSEPFVADRFVSNRRSYRQSSSAWLTAPYTCLSRARVFVSSACSLYAPRQSVSKDMFTVVRWIRRLLRDGEVTPDTEPFLILRDQGRRSISSGRFGGHKNSTSTAPLKADTLLSIILIVAVEG